MINPIVLNSNKIILITGANGFVGHHLAMQLSNNPNYIIRICVRKVQEHAFPENINIFSNLDLLQFTDNWDIALSGVNCIIHCAAKVHAKSDRSEEKLAEFRKINVTATLELAKKAIYYKIKRFIFISSIKVNGENSLVNKPFTADDKVDPSNDPYAISKMEAEQGLIKLAKKTDMEIVIIRPPLIYGPMVKANFKSMINLINYSIPLPFKKINNKRSLVSIYNLIDFINLCIIHPKAANQIFLISDGEDLSTSELLIKIAKALNKRIFWLPIPLSIIKLFTIIFSKNIYNKLTDNLQVDLRKNYELLGWKPLINIDAALQETINAFKNFKQ